MRSNNPVIGTLERSASAQYAQNQFGHNQFGVGERPFTLPTSPQQPAGERALTVDDIIAKTGITLAVIVVAAVANFALAVTGNPGATMGLTALGAIGGLIAVIVSSVSARGGGSAAVTLIYAVFEGLFVGGFSFLMTGFTAANTDIGLLIAQSVVGTFGVFAGMLYVYKSGAVKVTGKFRRVVTGAIFGVLAMVIINLIASFFGLNLLRDGGILSIVFSLVVIVIAAFTFLLDFDEADRLVRAGVPARYAWGIALGLAVTVVWLYTEILRFLSYFRD